MGSPLEATIEETDLWIKDRIDRIFINIFIRSEGEEKFEGVVFYNGSRLGVYNELKNILKKEIEKQYHKEVQFKEGVVTNDFLKNLKKNINHYCLIIFDITTTTYETYKKNLEREVYNSYIFVDLEGR